MAYIICEPCIGTKDSACVDVCPVDCIHPRKDEADFEGATQLYIHPDECIDCGACVPACPVEAIFALDEVPEKWKNYIEVNDRNELVCTVNSSAVLSPKVRYNVGDEGKIFSWKEIVGLLKTGSAFYAPSLGAVEMAEAILKDKKKILPCAVFLEGEYGVSNLFVGVPVKLGKNGVEQIIEISLTNEERAALHKSAAAVQELIDVLEI